MAPQTTLHDDEPKIEPIENAGFRDLDPDGILEQPFWERYNKRLEMPIGTAMSILVYAFGALLIFLLPTFFQTRDKHPVPVIAFGDDETGDGSEGNGGAQDLALGQMPQLTDINRLDKQAQINEVKDEIRERIKVDVGGDIEIPDGAAAALATLDKSLRDKLLGAKPGTGNGTTGGDFGKGNGPGGPGAGSTYARALRWVIKFDTSSGGDYVNQMAGLSATILVPSPDNKKLYIFKNPSAPKPLVVASDADLALLAQMIRFDDVRVKSVEAVAQALQLDYTPVAFLAYFPREIEDKLAGMEKAYRGKPIESIKQTTFKVVMKGGKYDLIVTDQILR